MRPIQLPEPPSPKLGTPEIFEGGVYGVVRRAVVIGNGYPGSENQSIGLVRALGLADKHVLYILHPRLHLNRFDLVITPKHDYYPLTREAQQQVPQFIRKWITPREPPDSHVVLTVGALHQVDAGSLRNAASAWRDEFAPLPKPLLVVNIGGPTGNCRYGADLARQLTTNLLSVLDSCGSIRICFSNRTPEKVSNVILKELGGNPKVYIWDGQEPNPHLGHLAWADAFVVTADSVSMISEVCSTGKPVYIMGAERCTWKFSEFHKSLKDRGVVRPFTGSENISESWSYPPLNETANQPELCDSKAGADLLDLILRKEGYGLEQSSNEVALSPPYFCVSPPSRAANPLIQDARFGDEKTAPVSALPVPSPSTLSSPRKAGCVRVKYGLKPAAVRVEGFDCLNRDRQNSRIPAFA